jgi:hypothetical protein
MFEDIEVSLAGCVVYVVYNEEGRILNTGSCQVEAVKMCANSWPRAKRAIYDAHVEVPDSRRDRIDVKTGEILRGVTRPGENN